MEKKRNRYAFVAAEILSSDNWSIYEALMESKDLLRRFWEFLRLPAPLDPLQASYFTKVNESLFDKKTEEMVEFLKSIDNAIASMIKHVDCPMIMDLLLKIISLERIESGQGIVEVRQFFFNLSPRSDWENLDEADLVYQVAIHPRHHPRLAIIPRPRAQLGVPDIRRRLHEGHHHRVRECLPERANMHRPERAHPPAGLQAVRRAADQLHARRRQRPDRRRGHRD